MPDYLTVRFNTSIPTFEATDGREHGEFEEGEKSDIPTEEAQMIARRGNGVIISEDSECPCCGENFSNPLIENDRVIAEHHCDAVSDEIEVSIKNN